MRNRNCAVASAAGPNRAGAREGAVSAEGADEALACGSIGQVQAQRRHGNLVVLQGFDVGIGPGRDIAAREADPIIWIASSVFTLLDPHEAGIALALERDGDAGDTLRRAIGEIDVDQNVLGDAGAEQLCDQRSGEGLGTGPSQRLLPDPGP